MAERAAASAHEDQEAYEEYNEEEQALQEDEASDEDEEAEAGAGYGARTKRRGRSSDRMRAVLDRIVDQCYQAWGIVLAPDQTFEERRMISTWKDELRRFLLSRPVKTNDLYWSLQEPMLEVVPRMYEAGMVPKFQIPTTLDIRVEAVYAMTGDVMVLILQHLLHNKSIYTITTQTANGPTATNPFNHDEYAAGTEVEILADLEDLDAEGPEHQPLIVVATARIKGVSAAAVADARVFEVENIVVVREEALQDQTAWADDEERGIVSGETSLREALQLAGTLLVPVTNLRSPSSGGDGPRAAAGGATRLTRASVNKMKLAELRLVCQELGLEVKARSKAPYQEALHAWVEEHGDTSEVFQGAQAAVKLTRFTYKNWMNAATDLQKTQHMLLNMVLSYVLRQHPRVQRWVQMFKRTTTMLLRRAINDRQAGTLSSRPGQPQYLEMSVNWLMAATCEAMLYRAMFLEQMANAMRGSEVRGLELADRFCKSYDTVKPVTAVAVGSLKMNGKTNQNGQVMYYCHLRHRDPRMCPVAADGCFQLIRFGVKGQPFPDLTADPTASEWYFLAVYPPARLAGGKMDYEEHRRHTRAALDDVDCISKKSTHLPRQGGADRVIDGGGSREQAMTHGHWARQDIDLSYLNSPNINTILLVAGFASLHKHYMSWTTLQPPQYCLDLLFCTPEGKTIQQQINILTERNKSRETRNITALNVAKYLLEIGTAALQAMPILEAYGLIKRGHPLMQHPAINNDQYRAYAVKQASYSMRLTEQFQLLETPLLGPVITQATPLGHVSSAGVSEEQQSCLVTGAVVTYAATSAAAYSQAQGVDLSDKAIFMLVTPDERDLLLSRRTTDRGPQAHARSGGQHRADSSGEAATPAAAAPQGPDQAAMGGVAGSVPASGDNPAGADTPVAAGGAAQTGSSTPAAGQQAEVPIGGDGGAAAATPPGPMPPPGGIDLQVEGDTRAQLALVVGLQLQLNQQQQLTNELLLQQGAGHNIAAAPTMASSMQRHDQQQQQQPPVPEQPASNNARRASNSWGSAQASKWFSLTTKDIPDMPALLQLFEEGWPLGQMPVKTYTGVADPGFGSGLPDSQKQQWDLMRQGYFLLKGINQSHGIGLDKAAQVVEVWRGNNSAVINADGTVSAAPPAGGLQAGTQLLQNLLPPRARPYTMNLLLQTARGLECVLAQKDSQKSAAGQAGGRAAKRQHLGT